MTYPLPAAKIKQAVHLIRSAKHTVTLTGAGISTPSGIDDFRSIGAGLWGRYNPMEVASLSAFRYSPYPPIDLVNAIARLVIINQDPTFLDDRADIIFRQDLAVVLPYLTTEVLGEQE